MTLLSPFRMYQNSQPGWMTRARAVQVPAEGFFAAARARAASEAKKSVFSSKPLQNRLRFGGDFETFDGGKASSPRRALSIVAFSPFFGARDSSKSVFRFSRQVSKGLGRESASSGRRRPRRIQLARDGPFRARP